MWKNYPLEFHKDAPLAALAAMAAHEQGKFWPFHDKMFGNQPKIQREFLLQYAKDVGLDVKRFQEALDTSRYKGSIDSDVAEAHSIGVTGTPAFFVNGRYLSGAQPFANFAKVINEELTKQKIPIPPGANAG